MKPNWNNPRTVTDELIRLQFSSKKDIVSSNYSIEDCSSRNKNFFVQQSNPLFIKIGPDQLRKEAVIREGFVYQKNPTTSFLVEPKYLNRDNGVLILEGMANASSLQSALEDSTPIKIQQMGYCIGQHFKSMSDLNILPAAHPSKCPWAFYLALPEKDFFDTLSPAAKEIIQLIQQNTAFAQNYQGIQSLWKSSTVIHNDIKLDNFLVLAPSNIYIIDWEIANNGDPLWDVALLFASILQLWLEHREVSNQMDSLSKFSPFCTSFWNSYATHPEDQTIRKKVMQFTAIALLKFLIESADNQQSPSRIHLLHLQVAQNILEHPIKAANDLFQL
jgi:hypothetical protein